MSVANWPNCGVADCPHKSDWPAPFCYAHAHGRPLRPEDPRVYGYFEAAQASGFTYGDSMDDGGRRPYP